MPGWSVCGKPARSSRYGGMFSRSTGNCGKLLSPNDPQIAHVSLQIEPSGRSLQHPHGMWASCRFLNRQPRFYYLSQKLPTSLQPNQPVGCNAAGRFYKLDFGKKSVPLLSAQSKTHPRVNLWLRILCFNPPRQFYRGWMTRLKCALSATPLTDASRWQLC